MQPRARSGDGAAGATAVLPRGCARPLGGPSHAAPWVGGSSASQGGQGAILGRGVGREWAAGGQRPAAAAAGVGLAVGGVGPGGGGAAGGGVTSLPVPAQPSGALRRDTDVGAVPPRHIRRVRSGAASPPHGAGTLPPLLPAPVGASGRRSLAPAAANDESQARGDGVGAERGAVGLWGGPAHPAAADTGDGARPDELQPGGPAFVVGGVGGGGASAAPFRVPRADGGTGGGDAFTGRFPAAHGRVRF
jgi:hypothetical protein